MTEPTEIDVMRAMVRAKIESVGTWPEGVKGNCQLHKTVAFQDTRFNVGWKQKDGWSGCAQCILTCCAILEDPDMPTESEELALRAELSSARGLLPPPIALVAVLFASFALGAFLAL